MDKPTNNFFDYSVVQPNINFSTFDKSFERITAFSFGQVIPILVEEVLPNSRVKLSIQDRFYFSPLVSVLMSSISAQFHYFYVPNNIICGYWDTFITRSQNGQMLTETELNVVNADMFTGNKVSFIGIPASMSLGADWQSNASGLPTDNFSSFEELDSELLSTRTIANFLSSYVENGEVKRYAYNSWLHTNDELSLISYLYDTGNVSVLDSNNNVHNVSNFALYGKPVNWLALKAYWKIWFDYYRDENLDLLADDGFDTYNLPYLMQDWFNSNDFVNGFKCSIFSQFHLQNSVHLIDTFAAVAHVDLLKPFQRSYRKDYFTSALPFQQKGEQVQLSFNVVGGLPVVFSVSASDTPTAGTSFTANFPEGTTDKLQFNAVAGPSSLGTYEQLLETITATAAVNNVPLVNIAELRAADSFQRALENMARVGTRYNEFLLGLFGTSPTDLRLQRPQYLGGVSQRVVTQDIFSSNAPTDSQLTEINPLGTRASMLDSASSEFLFEEEFKDYGYIIGLVSVMPQAYYLQGIDKKFLRCTSWDYYSPYLENLSEQPINMEELYITGIYNNNLDGSYSPNLDEVVQVDGESRQVTPVFGYQERWSDYKVNNNKINAQFRTNMQYLHQARIFGSAPTLNKEFIHTPKDGGVLRPFVDQDLNTMPPIWLDIYHELVVNLPMSYHSVPKLN